MNETMVQIKLALETPLTNCDIFPHNNDPNDLSVHISLTITITKISINRRIKYPM
jgi:hypothetical protein